jgi:YidC/Oxa1 family membrane protein insertase
MQRKNFIQFLIAAAIFIIALQWLMPKLFPPPRVEEKKAEPEAKASDRAFGLLPRDWLREQNLFGLVPGSWVFEQKLFSLLPQSWVESAQPVEPMFFGGLLRKRFLDEAVVAAAEARAAKAARDRRRLPHVRLGSDKPDSDYHLLVEFDPRGASVYRIVLNKFEATTHVGKPANELLELVPPDTDGFLNSNLLYHYDRNNPKADHPLDTLGKRVWDGGKKVEDTDGRQSISFSTVIQGVRITKTFTLEPHSYHLGLAVKLELTDPKHKGEKFRYQLTSGHLLPIDGRMYASTFRHSLIGRVRGNDVWRDYQDIREVALKQGGESVTPEEGKFIQYAGVAVQYFASVIVVDDDQDKRDFLASARPLLEARVVKIEMEEDGKLARDQLVVHDKKDRTKKETYHLPADVRFFVSQRRKGDRFNMLVVPDPVVGLRAVRLLPEAEAQPLFLDDMTARVNTEPIELGDRPVVHKYLLYNGPVKTMLLGQMKGQATVPEDLVNRYTNTLHLDTLTDYQSNGWLGSFSSSIYWTNLLIFFTNLMHRVLWGLHNLIPSYGICIILLTVLVRGLMFPISRKQALTSMKMQELAPELKKLQQKHKDDPRARTEEMMALYRKHGVNPLGSCWMLLLQMPIFMGLYYALQESVHFRLAGFLWMENLAAPDMLIPWGEKIPWISRPEDFGGLLYLGPYFNLLPVLAVTLMIFQQKLLMPPPTDEQQAMQQKMMKWMMIFFGLLFYKVAAGLCIYFIASSVWGFAERKLLPKKKPTTDGATADSLFQKMVGSPTPEPATTGEAVTRAPAGNGDNYVSNRARKRQDRKRRQERFQTQAAPRSERGEAPPPRRPAGDGEGGGWWARTRRRIRSWWQDVLKKASKK